MGTLYTILGDNPNYNFMAVNPAAVLMQTAHMGRGLELLNREIAESPEYARAWSNRAVIHYKRGEMALARADAEVAMRLDPSNRQTWNLLQILKAPAASPVSPR